MTTEIVHVGMDVHQRQIALFAQHQTTGEVAGPVVLRSDFTAVKRQLEKFRQRLGGEEVWAYYEAGPSGYTLYRALTAEGKVKCRVVAPAFIPRAPGDFIKTDRRDARKLAVYGMAGELHEVVVPTPEREAARDVLRLRDQAVEAVRKVKLRLGAFLRRQGIVYTLGKTRWTKRFRQWLAELDLELEDARFALGEMLFELAFVEEALGRREERLMRIAAREGYRELVEGLMAIRGVGWVTGLSVALEVGDLARFPSAQQFMAYVGLTCREHSSGERKRRGRITKMGNGLLRRMFVEAAWRIKRAPGAEVALKQRRASASAGVVAIAEKADEPLRKKYWGLVNGRKAPQLAAVAVARRLAGVIWAVGVQVYLEQTERAKRAA